MLLGAGAFVLVLAVVAALALNPDDPQSGDVYTSPGSPAGSLMTPTTSLTATAELLSNTADGRALRLTSDGRGGVCLWFEEVDYGCDPVGDGDAIIGASVPATAPRFIVDTDDSRPGAYGLLPAEADKAVLLTDSGTLLAEATTGYVGTTRAWLMAIPDGLTVEFTAEGHPKLRGPALPPGETARIQYLDSTGTQIPPS